ncbi:MAG: response regulator [Acidimicrobiia bacterium]
MDDVLSKILVIEDDDDVRLTMRLLLEDEGYRVLEAENGDTGLERFALEPCDLILLDLRLPGRSGLDICRELRGRSDVPIVMVTASDDSHDTVAALELGADDYVTKPFVPRELMARVRAQLRRRVINAKHRDDQVFGDLVVRAGEGTVTKAGEPVHLTKTEFVLLCFLAEHANQVLSRDQLLQEVWGYDYPGDGRLVDAHVRRLRTKIESNPAEPTVLLTVRGLGYRLVR